MSAPAMWRKGVETLDIVSCAQPVALNEPSYPHHDMLAPNATARRVADEVLQTVLRQWVHMSRLAVTVVSAAILSTACTYGDVQVRVAVQNVALSPNGELLAAIVKYERFRPPTGFAAFPDGGRPKVLSQRADLYVVDLGKHSMVFEGSVAAPQSRRSSFSPWVLGWTDHRVYFGITGCSELPGSECWGDLVGKSLYAYTPSESIREVSNVEGAVLSSKIVEKSSYANAGAEAYGVSFTREPGASRTPLLEFAGERLRLVHR